MIDTPLRKAFSEARISGDIDVIFPVFCRSKLYILLDSVTKTPFARPSPKGHQCVTVSENIEWIIKSEKTEAGTITGEQLFRKMPTDLEMIVAYDDGGDYLSIQQLNYFRQMIEF